MKLPSFYCPKLKLLLLLIFSLVAYAWLGLNSENWQLLAWSSSEQEITIPASGEAVVTSNNSFNSFVVEVPAANANQPRLEFTLGQQGVWGVPTKLAIAENLKTSEHAPDNAQASSGNVFASQLYTTAGKYDQLKLLNNDLANYQKVKVILIDNSPVSGYKTQAVSQFTIGTATIISRSGWGCPDQDPSSNYYCEGPFWQPSYYPTTHITVHHTASNNTSSDWAGVVRSIWNYHAHTRDADPDDGVQGWTDIGYHYLIDPNGVIYEGRYGNQLAPESESVTAGHTLGNNRGNIGIALIGTFTSQAPTVAAKTSLEALIQELIIKHELDPSAVNVSDAGTSKKVLSGHRDWEATACPGTVAYGFLPSLKFGVGSDSGLPLYRFLNRSSKVHFYTASAAEKAFVNQYLGGTWEFEGVSYYYPEGSAAGVKPVYRFLHKQLKVHFYTANESERDFIQLQLSGIWQYEGVAFQALSHEQAQVESLRPVYRFLHKQLKIHFYTASQSEKEFVEGQLANVWALEGVAYYVK